MIKYVLAICCMPFLHAEIKVIVSDLGFVVVEPHTLHLARELGISDCMGFILGGNTPQNLRELMYFVLTHAGGEQYEQDPELQMRDNVGNVVPQLFVEWQKGTMKTSHIRQLAHKSLKYLRQQNFFTHKRDYAIVKRCIRATFTPHILANNMRPSKEGVKLLNLLAQEGKYDFYIFSNWDAESFEEFSHSSEVQEEVLKFFPLEHIMTSGMYGIAKPSREFFMFFLSSYNLKPEECLLIDDQEENIAMARNLNMHTLKWNKKRYKKIIKQLRQNNILS